MFVSFGPRFSFIFIDLLYGAKWASTNAPTLLSYYCGYILVIGVNGVTEAFLYAAISANELKTYTLLLMVFSGAYLAACALLARLGIEGLILANALNMLPRVAFSLRFAVTHFAAANNLAQTPCSDPPLSSAAPNNPIPTSPGPAGFLRACLPAAGVWAACALSWLGLGATAALLGLSEPALGVATGPRESVLPLYAAQVPVGCSVVVVICLNRWELAFVPLAWWSLWCCDKRKLSSATSRASIVSKAKAKSPSAQKNYAIKEFVHTFETQ